MGLIQFLGAFTDYQVLAIISPNPLNHVNYLHSTEVEIELERTVRGRRRQRTAELGLKRCVRLAESGSLCSPWTPAAGQCSLATTGGKQVGGGPARQGY